MPKHNIRQSIRIDYEDVTHADGALNGFHTGGFFEKNIGLPKYWMVILSFYHRSYTEYGHVIEDIMTM